MYIDKRDLLCEAVEDEQVDPTDATVTMGIRINIVDYINKDF